MSELSEPSWAEIEDDGRATEAMIAEVQRVEAVNFEFMCDGFVYQQYASGRRVPNVYGLTSTRSMTYPGGPFPSLQAYDISSDNQIAIGVETLVATVGSARPWCDFTTVDGDFKQRQRAVRKGDYFYGLLKDTGFYAELPNYFRDMLTWSYGVCKAVTLPGKKKRIRTERCLPSEVLWDKAFSLVPNSSQPIYHQRFVLRRTLVSEFPEFREAIMTAPSSVSGQIPGLVVEIPDEFVALREGWWPSQTDKGRHILCVGETCINEGKTSMDMDEEHPFSFIKGYNVGPGWQYQGVVEPVLADQLRLNKQNGVIWENQHRGAQNRWLVEERSNVTTGSLVNRAAQVIPYKETPPQLVVFTANPPEMYTDRDATRMRILRRLGVNELSAKGTKPAGLNSGEAIREYGDESSARLTTLARNLEEFVVETTKKLDKLCERVKPVVKAPGKRSVKKLAWDDVALKEDSYTVELGFAISSLPRTPEGQVDKANELLQMGKLTPVQYARITLNADVPAEINALLAATEAIESILDDIVEEGVYVAPDDGLDLRIAFDKVNTRLWRCIADKAPDDIIGQLSDWRDEVKKLQDTTPAQPAPPGAAASPQMVPPGNLIPGPQPSQLPQ